MVSPRWSAPLTRVGVVSDQKSLSRRQERDRGKGTHGRACGAATMDTERICGKSLLGAFCSTRPPSVNPLRGTSLAPDYSWSVG
jgi:hypothetical protein